MRPAEKESGLYSYFRWISKLASLLQEMTRLGIFWVPHQQSFLLKLTLPAKFVANGNYFKVFNYICKLNTYEFNNMFTTRNGPMCVASSLKNTQKFCRARILRLFVYAIRWIRVIEKRLRECKEYDCGAFSNSCSQLKRWLHQQKLRNPYFF